MRINAKLDKQSAEDFRDQTRAKRQKQIWRESGLIGAFDGSEDVSSSYKQDLSDMLNAKYRSNK